MTESSPNRVPAGVPNGGQFAASAKSEAIVSLVVENLDSNIAAGHVGLTADGRLVSAATCAMCGNGYVSAHALAAHDCSAYALDEQTFAEWKGRLADGYTPETIDDLASDLKTLDLICVWDYQDDDDFGGDSVIYVRNINPDGTRGALMDMDIDLWNHLSEPDSDLDPAQMQWVADSEYPGQDLEDLPAWRGANYAVESRVEAE